jgi:hypothetical protein
VELRQHLLVALEHVVRDPYAELALELRDRAGGDVIRPIVDRELPLERGQRPLRIVVGAGPAAEAARERGCSERGKHIAAADAGPLGSIIRAHRRPPRAG